MKTAKYFSALLTALLFTINVNAQITVTGHATAEIVEAVSATSGTNNLLSLQQNTTTENLNLGSFTLSGGSNSICSVVVNSGQLTGQNGNSVNFTADANLANNIGVLGNNGSQVFNFSGAADTEILSQNDNNYEGQYNVVFAYN